MATREFAAVFARLSADRTGLARDLNEAVKDSQRAGNEIEKGFKRPVTSGFLTGLKQADTGLASIAQRAGSMVGVLTNPWALATAAIGTMAGALTSAVSAGIEFDREFTKIAALLDKEVDVEGLRQKFLNLDPALGTTTEAMQVFNVALKDTGDTDAAMEITKVALALGKVTQADPRQIAASIGSLADAFGVSATKAEDLANTLFLVAKKGGGDVAELGKNLGSLGDTLATLGIEGTRGADELGSALVTMGKVSGKSSEDAQQALNRILTGVASNTGKFRELGIDLDDLIEKNGAFVGTMLALQQASGGTRAKLTELGVPARALSTVLKLMSEEGIRQLRDDFKQFQAEKPGAVFDALLTRNKAVSAEMERMGVVFEKGMERAGDAILAFFRDKGELPLTKRVEELNAEIAKLDKNIDLVNRVNPGQTGLLEQQKKALQDQLAVVNDIVKARKEAQKVAADTGEVKAPDLGGIFSGMAKQNQAVKRELDRLGLSIETWGAKAGETIDRFFRDAGDLPLTQRVEELTAAIAEAEQTAEGLKAVGASTETVDAMTRDLKTQRDAVLALIDAWKQADEAAAQSGKKRTKIAEGLTLAQEAQLEKIRGLETKRVREQEDMAEQRKAQQIKLLADEAEAEAESATERVAIRRKEAEEIGRIDENRLLDKLNAIRRETEATQAAQAGDPVAREQKLLDLRIERDKVENELATNQQNRAARLTALEREGRQARIAEEDKFFQMRKSLGDVSLREEISRLQQITTESRRSKDERVAALVELYNKEQELRDKSRSAALGLIGKVQESFEKQGRSTQDVTAFEFDQELDRIRSEQENLVARVSTTRAIGGGVSLDELKQAVTFAGELEASGRQLKELGGTSSIFSQAFSVTGESGQNILAFRQQFADTTQTILSQSKAMSAGYGESMGEIYGIVDKTMTQIEQRVKVANGEITTSIIERTKTDIAKELDREAKRY